MRFSPISIDVELPEEALAELEANKRVSGTLKNTI
tara:strand:+ start:104 stop:208 length:105 start_codon:yes stop_codon:yes gene_type:complete